MSKERLEEIKENWNNVVWGIDKSDINWLIEQAERFEVLAEQHDEALAQNKRYREALEKIRLGSKYGVPHCSTRVKSINKIATKALEESE